MNIKLMDIIKKYLKAPEYKITSKANIIDDFSVDSLDKVELIMAIEDEFKISITDNQVEKIKIIQDLIDLVPEKYRH